jgi:hypothetical protein
MLPSDFFYRNVFLGCQEDELAICDRAFMGIDALMWGSDYPYTDRAPGATGGSGGGRTLSGV